MAGNEDLIVRRERYYDQTGTQTPPTITNPTAVDRMFPVLVNRVISTFDTVPRGAKIVTPYSNATETNGNINADAGVVRYTVPQGYIGMVRKLAWCIGGYKLPAVGSSYILPVVIDSGGNPINYLNSVAGINLFINNTPVTIIGGPNTGGAPNFVGNGMPSIGRLDMEVYCEAGSQIEFVVEPVLNNNFTIANTMFMGAMEIILTPLGTITETALANTTRDI